MSFSFHRSNCVLYLGFHIWFNPIVEIRYPAKTIRIATSTQYGPTGYSNKFIVSDERSTGITLNAKRFSFYSKLPSLCFTNAQSSMYLHCKCLCRLVHHHKRMYTDGFCDFLDFHILYILDLKLLVLLALAKDLEMGLLPKFIKKRKQDTLCFIEHFERVLKVLTPIILPQPVVWRSVPAVMNLFEYLIGWTFALNSISPSIRIRQMSLE